LDPYKLKYYSDYEYYLNINNKLKDIELNDIQEKSLYYFACNPYTSPYAKSKEKKINDFGIGYEKLNTTKYTKNKIIARQLCKLQLIDYDKIMEEKNHRNKKNYYVTELGIYYIMKRPIFLKIDIQSIIKNFPNLKIKIFEDLLYPFIKKDTICSSNFPTRILMLISSYIQKQYLNIENFILYAENKEVWEEKRLILNEGKLQNYLIKRYKYKYQWLETADTEQNDDDEDTIIKFVNIDQPSEYLEVRLRKDWLVIYLMNGIKKRKIPTNIPNIFQYERFFSREECINRSFSNWYSPGYLEFISSILPALTIDYKTATLFLQDKNFIRSLNKTKKEFENIYKSIKNPSKYSRETQMRSFVIEFIQQQVQKLLDKTVG
jgi:hypothetical protein